MRQFIMAMTLFGGAVLAAPADADIVAYYPLDGATDDISGNNNNATNFFGGAFTTEVPPQLGGGMALGMTGSAGVMTAGFEVQDDPSLDFPDELSISAWVNMADLATYYFVAVKGPTGTAAINWPGNYEFRIEINSGDVQFLHQTSDGQTLSIYDSTTPVTPSAWSHVAVTARAGGDVTMYVDGVEAGTFPQTGEFGLVNDNPLFIGTRLDSFSSFNGRLDDVALWDEVLSPEDINTIFVSGVDALLGPPPVPGDVDGNEVVDLFDYEIIRDNFHTGTTREEGNLDRRGVTDLDDFWIWRTAFEQGAAPASVPEPSAAALFVLAIALAFDRRRLRRGHRRPERRAGSPNREVS